MTLWEREHLAFLRRYENGIPSHDTLCDVFAARDRELFKACLLAWVSDLRDAVAEHLDLKGVLVTMDAMGTQTDIARTIRDGGGDYCMSLRKNWPAVYADVFQRSARQCGLRNE